MNWNPKITSQALWCTSILMKIQIYFLPRNSLIIITLIMVIWPTISQIMRKFLSISWEYSIYNASFTITSAIKGIFTFKLYNKKGLKSLKFRGSFRKLCTFYRIKSTVSPSYLCHLIPRGSHMYNTRSLEDVATVCRMNNIFKYSFLPSTILECNKLDLKIR